MDVDRLKNAISEVVAVRKELRPDLPTLPEFARMTLRGTLNHLLVDGFDVEIRLSRTVNQEGSFAVVKED